MKIGLVRRGYSPTGGAENYLGRLAAGLAAQGHATVLFASPQWPAGQRPPAAEFCPVDGRTPAAFAGALAALHPENRCDFLFSLERVWACDGYRAGDGVHRAWLDRRARFEPWWRSRWRRFHPKHRQLLALEAALFGPAGPRIIIANSNLVARQIVDVYGCASGKISVVYNGLPSSAFQLPERDRARAELGLAADDYAVLFAGTGWERKGLAAAIAAIAQLPDQPRPRLLVAGRGDARSFRRRLGRPAAERVQFLGEVREMAGCYAAADAFVLPTLYDPFSNACLEALAAGLPVVTTADNGFAEIIEPGVDGEILPGAGDVAAALAKALHKWSNAEYRAEHRTRRLAKAATFTIERNVSETLRIITASPAADQDHEPSR